jgi:DNA-binding transcriptional ArsR family regulator
MAKAKRQEFEIELVRLAELGRALAHPARVAILQTLAERRGCICGEIVEVLPLAQSTVSQHLRVLQEIGVVKGEIDGPRCCYCIDWKRYNELITAMRDFLNLLPPEHEQIIC